MLFTQTLDKTVGKLFVSKGEQAVKLVFPSKHLYISTDGDCCSETWFADIVGVSNLLGNRVTGVHILDIPVVEDGRTRQEEDEFYGFRLSTAKGDCDFIYRNSSNGYYGGDICAMSEEEAATHEWIEIKEDWQA